MASSTRAVPARPLPPLGVAFVRWSFARGGCWRGYWLLASIYLVVVADLPASQLVLIGAAQAAVVLVAELPAGVYADAAGRRRCLVVAHIVTAGGMVMLGLVTSFPLLALSQGMCGLGWAFASGADVAWITDELDDPGAAARVLAVRARWELVGAAAGLVGFGGLARVTGLRTGIVVSGLLMLALGAVVVLRFPERRVPAPDARRRWPAGVSLLGGALRLARHDREILLVTAAWLLVSGGGEAYGRLLQKQLIGLGFGAGGDPVLWFTGLGLATLAVGTVALRAVEDRIDDEGVAQRTIVAWCAAGGVGLALFATAADARYAIAGVVLATGALSPGAVVRAMTEIWVNRRTTSGVRATVHSLLSLAEHVGEIAFGTALAAVAAAGGLTASMLGAAGLLAGAGGLVSRARPRTRGPGCRGCGAGRRGARARPATRPASRASRGD
ncbi:MAG TPA: MFS transporter [Actinomycetes bacterium]|nr:MFS transporter [Actinomycetes bacterium]